MVAACGEGLEVRFGDLKEMRSYMGSAWSASGDDGGGCDDEDDNDDWW